MRLSLLLALLAAAGAARAAPSCTVTVAAGLAFGTYDTLGTAPLDSQLSVQLKCPKPLQPQAWLSRGSAPSFFPRTMRNGSEILPYNVFLDAGRTSVWGDGTGGSTAWFGPPGNSTIVGFGRIAAGQDVAVGAYSDTLVLTVLF